MPGGGDPVLAAHGITVDADRTEGAAPSGAALLADAAARLGALVDPGYLALAERAIAPSLAPALERPIAYGATLAVAARLAAPLIELVVVTPGTAPADDALLAVARAWARPGRTLAIVTEEQAGALAASGFALFGDRVSRGGRATAYLCEGFTCRLPTTDAAELGRQLA